MIKKIILSIACMISLSTNALILEQPEYSFPNGAMRNNIKRSLKYVVNDVIKNTPCIAQMDYINDNVVQFDRNVLMDFQLIKNNKQVYYTRLDINRESFIQDVSSLIPQIEKRCK